MLSGETHRSDVMLRRARVQAQNKGATPHAARFRTGIYRAINQVNTVYSICQMTKNFGVFAISHTQGKADSGKGRRALFTSVSCLLRLILRHFDLAL